MSAIRGIGIVCCFLSTACAVEVDLYYLQENLKEQAGLVEPVASKVIADGIIVTGSTLVVDPKNLSKKEEMIYKIIWAELMSIVEKSAFLDLNKSFIVRGIDQKDQLEIIKNDMVNIFLNYRDKDAFQKSIERICTFVLYLQVREEKLDKLEALYLTDHLVPVLNVKYRMQWKRFVNAVINRLKDAESKKSGLKSF